MTTLTYIFSTSERVKIQHYTLYALGMNTRLGAIMQKIIPIIAGNAPATPKKVFIRTFGCQMN